MSLSDNRWQKERARGFAARRQDWGFLRAVHWQVMHALVRLIGLRLHRVEISAGTGNPDKPAPERPEGYTFKVCNRQDLLPYADSVEDFSQAFLDTASQRGDDCAAGFCNGELVTFTFTSRVRAPVSDQLDVVIPDGFRYSYKAWTHQDHRRKNLFSIVDDLLEREKASPYGERWIWIVETHNYQSRLHTYRHPNRRSLLMGYGGWFSLFGRQIPFSSRRARWIGLEFVRRADDRVHFYVD